LPDARAQFEAGRLRVRWTLSAHTRRLLTLGIGGLVLAVVTGRPEFAGLAAPALLLLATRPADRPESVNLRVLGEGQEVIEGDHVPFRVALTGQHGYDAELQLVPAPQITPGPPAVVPAAAAAAAAAAQPVRLEFRPERWGRRRIGAIEVVLRDPARLTEGSLQRELPKIDCFPLPAQLGRPILLSRLPNRLGEHAARATGDGLEFAGVREFVPGDRQRRINWAATTRRGTLHLTTFAAERTMNVVIIADTSADVGEPGKSSLDLVQRGAAGTMATYLASRDRVGLVRFGSQLSWIGPGQGRRQYRRLMELLVGGTQFGERPAALARLPRAALPPGALIIAFSPLLDPRMIEAVRDLRERGFAVLVIDVLNSKPRHDNSAISNLAGRLWQLEQQAIRFSLTEIGVPVVHWDGVASLDEPLAPYTRRSIVVGRR
jgi:uncharacterized protein (DUF58 family)